MKILVVDDDEDIVSVLEFRIQQIGHEVEVSKSGAAALEKVAASPPDLILMDLNIPPPNGKEVAETLRKDPKSASIPIVLLTGSAHLTLEELEVNELISKPFEWEQVKTVIEKYS